MNKSLLSLAFMLLSIQVFCQKTEFGISLNSGLFSFSGSSATGTSFMLMNSASGHDMGYTNNPYGSRNGLCSGVSVQLQRIARRNLIAGIDFGYENLKSKVIINQILLGGLSSSNYYAANGQTFLNYQNLNLFGYLGYRCEIKKFSFDMTGGFDISQCLTARESGSADIATGDHYSTDVDRKTISIDVRPRIQISATYHYIGLYLGYSYGLANYMNGLSGGTDDCYAREIRFGVNYHFRMTR
ncbi:MAG: hypothetical protein Q8908_12605 [Bacteroidota bacterium]|nr:hypothetical protein [Bacteroidota bacterium]